MLLRVPNPLPGLTGVQLWYTFGSPCWGHLSPLKGPHPFWTPKREGGTGDPFGDMVALLSAAAWCFRAWVSVEIPWRRVLLPLLAVANKCYRAQPLINIEGATKHKHGMTCAVELFYSRHVRSCAASAFWKPIHMFRNEMRHMHARWLGDTENQNGDA